MDQSAEELVIKRDSWNAVGQDLNTEGAPSADPEDTSQENLDWDIENEVAAISQIEDEEEAASRVEHEVATASHVEDEVAAASRVEDEIAARSHVEDEVAVTSHDRAATSESDDEHFLLTNEEGDFHHEHEYAASASFDEESICFIEHEVETTSHVGCEVDAASHGVDKVTVVSNVEGEELNKDEKAYLDRKKLSGAQRRKRKKIKEMVERGELPPEALEADMSLPLPLRPAMVAGVTTSPYSHPKKPPASKLSFRPSPFPHSKEPGSSGFPRNRMEPNGNIPSFEPPFKKWKQATPVHERKPQNWRIFNSRSQEGGFERWIYQNNSTPAPERPPQNWKFSKPYKNSSESPPHNWKQSNTPASTFPPNKWKHTNRDMPDRPPKRPRDTERKPRWENHSGIDALVVPEGFPGDRLDDHQMELVQVALQEAIDCASMGGVRPQFLDFYKKRGFLKITANNEQSAIWLRTIIVRLVPFEGARLKVIEAGELSRLVKFMVWVPGPAEDPEKVIRRLGTQNYGLKTEGWRLINCKVVEQGQTLVIKMDSEGAKELEKINFRPFLNFTRVHFKSLEKMERPPPNFQKKYRQSD